MLLVLRHQHHGTPSWTYQAHRPRHLSHSWDLTIRSSRRCCPFWMLVEPGSQSPVRCSAIETLRRSGQEPSKEEVQKLHKNFFNYSTLIVHIAGRGEERLRRGEHEFFLFYWYNKFICCTKSTKCLVENMPVAEALASGHVLALSPAILAILSRCLAEATTHKIDPYQSGPLWVFQLWLQTYFTTLRPKISEFLPTEALGLQLASRPVPPHQAEDIFKVLLWLGRLFRRRIPYLSSS